MYLILNLLLVFLYYRDQPADLSTCRIEMATRQEVGGAQHRSGVPPPVP